MKKILLVVSIASALSLVNVANADSGGTITFNGKVSDQTCAVVLNNGTSATGTVTMRTVQKDLLDSTGDVAGREEFTLNLSNCTAATSAYGVLAYFPNSATYIDSTTSTLINQETGLTAATKVGLELVQVNGTVDTVIPLGKSISDTNYKFTTVPAGDTEATMNYVVRYKNLGLGPVTAGLVKGVAVYELSYQ